MAERVSSGSVERQFRTDTDANHHETQLVVQTISQHTAQVVFDHGEDDREQRHRTADPD